MDDIGLDLQDRSGKKKYGIVKHLALQFLARPLV